MSKFSLNPLKGITLKKAQGWIRKTINGKRKRVPVDFTKGILELRDGNILLKENGRFSKVSVYDIVNLAENRGAFNKFGRDIFAQSNKAGMNMSREEAFDLITERFNLYNKYNGWRAPVAYIYSKKSRVIRGTENLIAVRLRNGQKGWLDANGRFISQDSMYNMMLGLDGTVASGQYGFSFGETWAQMSAQQRADFTDKVKDVDWDVFWHVKYRTDSPLDEEWLDAFDEVANALLEVVG